MELSAYGDQSAPSRSYLNDTAARRHTSRGVLPGSGHCKAWRQSPLFGEEVLDAAVSLQAARASSGQASFGRAEQVDLTE